MKNQLLFGAIAASIATFGLGTTQAQALDLTGVTATTVVSGTTLSGAYFQTIVNQGESPTGTGSINPFLTIQENIVEEGFNTSYRTGGGGGGNCAPLDAGCGNNTRTRDLLLSDVPIVDGYYRFFLDINESNSDDGKFLNLLDLKVYLSDDAGLSSLDDLMPVFELGEVVNLKDVNSGSGRGDLFVDLKFEGTAQYLYLYSKFGDPDGRPLVADSDAGFEEWYVGTKTPTTEIPTPAAVLPILGGLFGAASRRKKGQSTEA